MVHREDQYFSQTDFFKEAALLTRTAKPAEETVLTVPSYTEAALKEEAFYCRIDSTEMPSRAVLYGATVFSCVDKGGDIGFHEVSMISDNLAGRRRVRNFPFIFPSPEAAIETRLAAESREPQAVDGIEVTLDPLASSLIQERESKNGFSSEANFLALLGLINFIGVNERVGRYLTLRTSDSESF